MTGTQPTLQDKWLFLDGADFYKSFIKGRPMSDGHNTASYAIVREGHAVTQDGTHGPMCRCDGYDCGHLIAADAPYYNDAPSYDDARMIVAALEALRDLAAVTECYCDRSGECAVCRADEVLTYGR